MSDKSKPVQERQFTAPAGEFVDGKTAALEVIDVTAQNEKVGDSTERLSDEVYTRALGEIALTEEDKDLIESNHQYVASLKRFAGDEVGSIDELRPKLEAWLDAVRVPKLTSESQDELDDDVPESERPHVTLNKFDKLSGTPLILLTKLTDKWNARRARKQNERSEKISAKKANLAGENLTAEQLRDAEAKIDADEERKIKIGYYLGGGALAGLALGGLAAYANYRGLYHIDTSKGMNSLFGLGFGPGAKIDPTQIQPAPGGNNGNTVVPDAPRAPGGNQPPLSPDQLPGVPQTREQMQQFFDSAIDPASYDDKGHVNDFNRPIPNGNNPQAFKLALAEQLRGNEHELARYLSKAKIPGVPLESDFPGNQAGYLDALNNYADTMNKNPELHFKQFTLLAEKFNSDTTTFKVRDITNAYKSDYYQFGKVGIDGYVAPSGTVTEVTFNTGMPDQFTILVRNECGQTIEELFEAVKTGNYTVVETKHGSEYVVHKKPQVSSVTTSQVQSGGSHGGGSGGNQGGGTPPVTPGGETPLLSKDPTQNHDLHVDPNISQNGELAPSGAPQTRAEVDRAPHKYTPGGTAGNDGSTATGASETGGSYGQAGPAESGLNPSTASTGGSTGAESSTGSAGADSGSDAGNQSSRASE